MQPLSDILVVSVEQAVAAPLCTARLAAAGARVIKVEREEGDFARNYDSAAMGESSYFTWLNQGKESVCLNFKDEHGARILWSILERADVLIQNLAPGALARAGFDSGSLHAKNSRLIICNISGYGNRDEVSGKRGYDLLVQAESGLISVSGSAGRPGRIGVSICDIGAGMTAYSGILEAILKRNQTGRGEEIGISLFDVAAEWMVVPYIHAQYGNGAPKPVGLRHPSIAPYGAFECADKRLVLISIQNEREWKRLCENVLMSPALAKLEKYATNNDRVSNISQLESDISAITKTISSAEFQTRLAASKIAFGAINDVYDLQQHPALRTAKYTNVTGQSMNLPAQPVLWSTECESNSGKSPAVGEHTARVIAEFMGDGNQ